MGVNVVTNRHGYLRFRIFWRGRDVAVSTRYRDDGPDGRNSRLVGAKALLIAEKLRDGAQLHHALLDVLGDCPPRLMPVPQIQHEIPTVRAYYARWIDRQRPPLVRASTATRNRLAFDNVLLALVGDLRLNEIRPTTLLELRAKLLERKWAGRSIGVKAVRNFIDWHLRALYRDAREKDGYELGDPFALISWPEVVHEDPDPFTVEERDKILSDFRSRKAFWHPFVAFQFFTGCRPSETAALRWSDVDLKAATVTIRRSRSYGEEAAPKTRASRRTIALFPDLLEILRRMPEPLHIDENTYFFRNPDGNPITTNWWPKKSWHPVLRRLQIRPRKFYATRHTFISDLLSRGEDLKAIAEYCGTSVAMIERSYGRWMPKGVDRGVRSLRALLSNSAMFDAKTGPFTGPLMKKAAGDGLTHGSGTGKESGPTGNRTGTSK
jgi:integrase